MKRTEKQTDRTELALAGREVAVANSSLTVLDTVDGWHKISPYGTFPGAVPGRPQYFTQAEAEAMVGEFNSLRGRLGRLFRGVPIYRGHPDVDPSIWPDDRRYGKYTAVEARSDGLWGKAVWNALGRENAEEEYLIYPSPRWDAPAGGSVFRPDRLLSVGLTNTPRIPTSEPIFNAMGAVDTGAVVLEEETDDKRKDEEYIMDKQKLIELMGLHPEATDEEVYAAVGGLKKQADDAAEAEQMAREAAAAEQTRAEALENAVGALRLPSGLPLDRTAMAIAVTERPSSHRLPRQDW